MLPLWRQLLPRQKRPLPLWRQKHPLKSPRLKRHPRLKLRWWRQHLLKRHPRLKLRWRLPLWRWSSTC